MTIEPTVSFSDWIATEMPGTRLIAHPNRDSLSSPDVITRSIDADTVNLTIGPEGGFSDQEIAIAQQAGWLRFDLGTRILRIETAAIAAAAILGLPQNNVQTSTQSKP